MSFRLIALASMITLGLSGCATSSYTVGRDFMSTNISQIVKGKTTSSELVALVGEPYTKTVLSETDEKWIYMYSAGTAKAQSYVFSMDVQTTGTQKTLDVLISEGVVVNYAYTEGALPYSVQMN
ncbi:hypothetical protein [Shewanella indica]|uniref:hypothetical protein n=1 Tax=Shewanella indica TaxID=768528 RepID=UPI001CFDD654|nr:hypothetical protein [Shewanella indica]